MSRPTRRPLRRAVATTLLGVLLVACGGDDGLQQVGPVTIEVPRGWNATDPAVAEELVAGQAWQSSEREGMTLQVYVGCGQVDADELTVQAASQAREPLTLIDIDDGVTVEVDGLEEARRTTMVFSADGSSGASAQLAGLYGTAGETLVLVELFAPSRSYSASLADEVLGSVSVDPDERAASC